MDMRHVTGIGLAIVMAAAVFFAASWGYLKLLIGPAKSGVLPAGGGSLIHDHAVLEGFGVLLAVGLLAGILMAVPVISPLASGLPGLALLAWTGLYLYSVRRAVHYIPLKSQSYGTGFEAMLFDGVLAAGGPGHDHPVVRAVQMAKQGGRRRARALRGHPGRLSRSGSYPDHGGRRRAPGRLGRDQAAAPDGARPFAGALGSGGSRDPGRPGQHLRLQLTGPPASRSANAMNPG